MRTVIQRVKNASVNVSDQIVGKIDVGLLVLLSIEDTDTEDDINWMCRKIINLRIFNDQYQLMNLSINDIEGEILVVSQFTLFASTKKGNRPSFIKASKPDFAIPMYDEFCIRLNTLSKKEVKKKVFGADMQIELINNGPVTIIIDSKIRE